MYALLLEISVYSFLIFLLYGNQLRSSRTKLMGHFWVTKSLCFKAILKCKAIDMRMFFLLLFSCKYSITHFEFYKHLESFWKWEFLELGNYFVSRLSVYLSSARDTQNLSLQTQRDVGGFPKEATASDGQKHVSVRSQAIQKNCLGRGQEVNGLGFVSS